MEPALLGAVTPTGAVRMSASLDLMEFESARRRA